MKQRTQWITALLTVASAGVAMGCGCSSETVRRIEPVREVIVQQPSVCLAESRSTLDFGAPFRTVGRVISAPFFAIGNAFGPSYRYSEPVGEQLYSISSYQKSSLMPVGERFTTTRVIRMQTLEEPVGERVILRKHHYRTFTEPVGERFTTRKHYYRTTREPIGERIAVTKHHHHKKMLKPVGEKVSIKKSYHKGMLKPVGEQFTTQKRYQKAHLKPVSERQTTRIQSQQW